MADFASPSSGPAAAITALSSPPRRDRVLAYAFAVALMAAAYALHLTVEVLSTPQADFIFLVPAVLLAGAVGGLGPGLLATFVCLGLHLFVTSAGSAGSVTADEAATAMAFLFIGVGTAGFGEWLRRARRRAAISMHELAAREAHLASILATIPDAMIVIDDKGLIQSFNAAAQRLFGHTEEEAVGRNVSMLMPSVDAEAHDRHIARYLRTGERHIIGSGRVVAGERTGRLDLSDRDHGGRDAAGRAALLHRLRPRHLGAAGGQGAAAGAAGRACPHLPAARLWARWLRRSLTS